MNAIGAVGIASSLALVLATAPGCKSRGAIPPASSGVAPILLFNGTGTSAGDVAAVEAILKSSHLGYATANSSQLNEMSESRLRAYRLLIVPGGNFLTIGNNLTSTTATNIHGAVQDGLSYLGICAGAFLAGDSIHYKTLKLAPGVQFKFYADEDRGIRKEAVAIGGPGTATLDQYWEDGPELTGWGAIVGKYPDGTPAIVEGASGKGWVILSGVHPEAPTSWRRGMSFRTPVEISNGYAATLIDAALNRTSLPHY